MSGLPLLEKLRSEVLVSDGAMGTELQKHGLQPNQCPEEFNLTQPDVVQQIHRSYFAAGADIITTNSFGANRLRLRNYGFEQRVKEICRRAGELAREVCLSGRYVAGSIGPTGEILEPLGQGVSSSIQDSFREQAEALAESGVDLLIVETMMALEEAELAVQAAKNTGLTVAATMSFEGGPRGFRTMWGVDIPTAVGRLSDAGVDIVGSNCGRGFDEMVEIIKEICTVSRTPVIAQPNAGLPQWIDGKAVYPTAPALIELQVRAMIRSGANIVGGCCGTGPEHIHTIRGVVDSLRNEMKEG